MSSSAIVLAGGRSSRFGSAKLEALLDGVPLLHRAVIAVSQVAEDVVVVAPPAAEVSVPEPSRLPNGTSLRIVRDREPFGGPLVGLAAGLTAASQPIAVIVGGDMPRLVPSVLAAMLARLSDGPDDAAPRPAARSEVVLLDQPGGPRALPAAVRVAPATAAVRFALGAGERSLRAAFAGLSVIVIAEQEWRGLDPGAGSLVDIDRPEDLDAAGGAAGG